MTNCVDGGRHSFYPFQVIPELYADLDLQLLTATDDATRWAALIAGTREVLYRLFYNLLDTHLGLRLHGDELFDTPDDVDVRPF